MRKQRGCDCLQSASLGCISQDRANLHIPVALFFRCGPEMHWTPMYPKMFKLMYPLV